MFSSTISQRSWKMKEGVGRFCGQGFGVDEKRGGREVFESVDHGREE